MLFSYGSGRQRIDGKKGHGAKFICPITHLKHHLSAILYIDDTDLLHIDLSKDETVDDVHSEIQASVNSWGNLLIATGGVLQPAKCFYSIISFDWILILEVETEGVGVVRQVVVFRGVEL